MSSPSVRYRDLMRNINDVRGECIWLPTGAGDVGDCGYISDDGYFHKLFSVFEEQALGPCNPQAMRQTRLSNAGILWGASMASEQSVSAAASEPTGLTLNFNFGIAATARQQSAAFLQPIGPDRIHQKYMEEGRLAQYLGDNFKVILERHCRYHSFKSIIILRGTVRTKSWCRGLVHSRHQHGSLTLAGTVIQATANLSRNEAYQPLVQFGPADDENTVEDGLECIIVQPARIWFAQRLLQSFRIATWDSTEYKEPRVPSPSGDNRGTGQRGPPTGIWGNVNLGGRDGTIDSEDLVSATSIRYIMSEADPDVESGDSDLLQQIMDATLRKTPSLDAIVWDWQDESREALDEVLSAAATNIDSVDVQMDLRLGPSGRYGLVTSVNSDRVYPTDAVVKVTTKTHNDRSWQLSQEAFDKLLEAIEDAKSNNEDVAAFRVFLVAERAKLKKAVDDAPDDRRPELDYQFAGITDVLSRGKVDIDEFAALDPVRQYLLARTIKAKLAELKETLKRQVDSYVTSSVNLVLENQRRELERVMLERLDPVISGTVQGKDAPSGCMEGTREELLRDIIEWANSPTGPCVFWLSGLTGTGKTAVARSVADRLAQAGIIVVSFFISRHSGRRGSIYDIVKTLAFELARVHETARAIIVKALERDARLHELNLDEQVNRLLLEPLRAVSTGSSNSSVVMLLDALDECESPAALVGDGWLAKLIPALGGPGGIGKVKLFLTSRPLTTIGTALRPFLNRLGQEVRLHEIPTTDDIRTYLDRSLSELCHSHNMPTDWFSASDLNSLVHRAGSLFIYAATVIRHIKEDVYAPHERLAEVLSIVTTSSEVGSPYEEVDKLYLEVLSLSVGPKQPKSLTDRVRQIIAVVVLARPPMSTRMISDLLNIDHGTVQRIVSGLGAVWVTPASESEPIVLYHKSFPDFILDTSRCTDPRFLVNCSTGHELLTTGCLHVLNTLLVRDICKIPFPAGEVLPRRDSISDIDTRLARYVSPPLRYSTVHLLYHLAQIVVADISQALVDNLRVFCQKKLLFWLELTCLMGPTMLSDLIIQLTGFPAEILDHDRIAEYGVLLRQLGQAAQYFEHALRASHAEVYNSLLAFMPKNALRRAYSDIWGFIRAVHADDWNYPPSRALIRELDHNAESFVTTADGSVVACVGRSVHGKGQSILVWQNATKSSMHHSIPLMDGFDDIPTVLLALDPSGRTLVFSSRSNMAEVSEISVWQLCRSQPVLIRTRSVNGKALALAVDPTGMHVVHVSQRSVTTLTIVDLMEVIGRCHEFPRVVHRAKFSSAGTALIAVSSTSVQPYAYLSSYGSRSSTGTTVMVCRADCEWKVVNCGTSPNILSRVDGPSLFVSCDGLTAGFPSDRNVLVIYHILSQGQHGIISATLPAYSWAISSDGCCIAHCDTHNSVVHISRLQWQPTPQLQRWRTVDGSEWYTPVAVSEDHSDVALIGSSYGIELYSATADKVTFQQNHAYRHPRHPGQYHATFHPGGHAIYSFAGGLYIIDMQAALNFSDPAKPASIAQSSCGMFVAVIETSEESAGTVGTVWNISSGTSHTIAAPELTGYVPPPEFTLDGLNLVVMDQNGLAVLPINGASNSERRYIQLRQNDLKPSGLSPIFSHDQKHVAVDFRNDRTRTRLLSVWDFPSFSKRRDFDLADNDRSVTLSCDGNLVAWISRHMVHVTLVDQSDDPSSCTLQGGSYASLAFCTSSPHLLVKYQSVIDLWDLTDVGTPVLLRSFQPDSPLFGSELSLVLHNDGGHYIEIYRRVDLPPLTRETRGVSPWAILAMGDDCRNLSESELDKPQVKAVWPAHALDGADSWLKVVLGTSRTLRASPPEREGDRWIVTGAGMPISHNLCWLPDHHRRPAFHVYSKIFWSGAHFFWRAQSGAVTILDCSDHPLFQQPSDSESTSDSAF